MRSLVLTLLGPDRPGLVEALAELVTAHGGNWAESRMASLAGQFAGILRIEVPDARAAELELALTGLEAKGLHVKVKAGEGGGEAGGEPAGELLSLDLIGQDRPGIVRQISQALAGRGINVEELDTECSSAPMSGETLFQAKILLRVPPGGSHESLRAALEEIAADLMVDIELRAGGEA